MLHLKKKYQLIKLVCIYYKKNLIGKVSLNFVIGFGSITCSTNQSGWLE